MPGIPENRDQDRLMSTGLASVIPGSTWRKESRQGRAAGEPGTTRQQSCLRNHMKWTLSPSVCKEVEEDLLLRLHPSLSKGPSEQMKNSCHSQDDAFSAASYAETSRSEAKGATERVQGEALRIAPAGNVVRRCLELGYQKVPGTEDGGKVRGERIRSVHQRSLGKLLGGWVQESKITS